MVFPSSCGQRLPVPRFVRGSPVGNRPTDFRGEVVREFGHTSSPPEETHPRKFAKQSSIRTWVSCTALQLCHSSSSSQQTRSLLLPPAQPPSVQHDRRTGTHPHSIFPKSCTCPPPFPSISSFFSFSLLRSSALLRASLRLIFLSCLLPCILSLALGVREPSLQRFLGGLTCFSWSSPLRSRCSVRSYLVPLASPHPPWATFVLGLAGWRHPTVGLGRPVVPIRCNSR